MTYNYQEIHNNFGGHWHYNILDFYYLANNYFPPLQMIKRLQKNLPVLLKSYPSTQRVIVQSLAEWKNEPYFKPENLIIGNGSSEIIRALNSIISKIVVPLPIFNEFLSLPEEKIHIVPGKEENKFAVDVDELIFESKKSESQFIVVNNPGNPVGDIIKRKDIEKLLQTNRMVIVDEAYIDFAPGYSVEDLILKYNNLIIIKSLTKVGGAGGLRIGYLLTDNGEIKEKIKRYLPIWNINSISEEFIEIFPQYQKEYDVSIKKTIADKKYLFGELEKISFLEPWPSFANFIFCQSKINGQDVADKLLEKNNIFIKPGLKQKSLQFDNYLRVGARTKQDIDKIIKALKKIDK